VSPDVSRDPAVAGNNAKVLRLGFYPRAGKRLFDVSLSLGALVLLSPLFALIALLIVVMDSGPVIFVQQRVGRHGLLFSLYKFRSMPIGTKNLPSDKIGSLKLTTLGRILRRTNLDELPQLLNILRGDMSFVGPRPPIPVQTELIRLRELNGSLLCLPGLTGLAQINGYDGMPVPDKARCDGAYAANVSFLEDLRIMLRTVVYLAKPPPVY
jgi:O-antigen biosynthesis protein WbqP